MNGQDTIVRRQPSAKPFLDNFAYFLLGLVVVLIPLIILPLAPLPQTVGKKFFLSSLVLSAFFFWLVGRLQTGMVRIPKSLILLGSGAILLVTALSSLFSKSGWLSLSGRWLENDTFVSLTLFVLLLFLVATLVDSEERARQLFFLSFLAFVAVFLFQIFQVAWAGWLSGSGLSLPTDNLVGRWNELGLFFGWIVIIAAAFLDFKLISRRLRYLLIFVALAALLGLIVVAFPTAWFLVGLVSLALFVFTIRANAFYAKKQTEFFTRFSFWLLVVAVLFTVIGGTGVFGGLITASLNERLGTSSVEIRPSLSGTMAVTVSTLKESPLLGAGPNKFAFQWLRHRPAEVVASRFFNLEFDSGFGYLTSRGVVLGAAGILAWFIFLVLVVYAGYRLFLGASLVHLRGGSIYFLCWTAFLGAIYWWFAALVYPLETVGLMMAFVATGLLIGLSVGLGLLRPKTVILSGRGGTSLTWLLAIVALIVGVILLLAFLFQQFGSLWFYRDGLLQQSEKKYQLAEESFTRAAHWYENDEYYRELTGTYLQLLRELTLSDDTSLEAQQQFRDLAQAGLAAGRETVRKNPLDYRNHQALAEIYSVLGSFVVEGAVAAARDSYDKALGLTPRHPPLKMAVARFELGQGNELAAREAAMAALVDKPDYLPALFLLGYLEYQRGGYGEVTALLSQAVAFDPNFSDARYFLGLAYDKIGERALALEQFLVLSQLNPNNQEIKNIISNLEAGNPAISP